MFRTDFRPCWCYDQQVFFTTEMTLFTQQLIAHRTHRRAQNAPLTID